MVDPTAEHKEEAERIWHAWSTGGTDGPTMPDLIARALATAEARGREIGNRERDADVERQRAVWEEQARAAEARGFERGQSAERALIRDVSAHLTKETPR